MVAAVTNATALASRHVARLSRRFATDATAAATTPSSSPAAAPTSASPRHYERVPIARSSRHMIRAAVLLNRSPILTRDPTPFERAFYTYQERLRRAFHNPFPYDFYFKPGSILESKFTYEERDRERYLFFNGFGATSKYAPEPKLTKEQLEKFDNEDSTIMPREHPSDVSGDTKSLDRAGQRNLYLLLQYGENKWRFPEGDLEREELLHEAANRHLHLQCGENMDTWIVGRQAIGHFEGWPEKQPAGVKKPVKAHTFFHKGHIMSGQVQLSGPRDFAWLTKEEIGERLQSDEPYWDAVKDMLSDY